MAAAIAGAHVRGYTVTMAESGDQLCERVIQATIADALRGICRLPGAATTEAASLRDSVAIDKPLEYGNAAPEHDTGAIAKTAKSSESSIGHDSAIMVGEGTTLLSDWRERKEAARKPHRARGAVLKAVKHGTLVRPARCSRCGYACKPVAHHDDYARPLDVTWLCGSCHIARHVELGWGHSRQSPSI